MKYIKTQEGLFSRKKEVVETSEDKHRKVIAKYLRRVRGGYTINPDMSVDVDGDVTLIGDNIHRQQPNSWSRDLKELPMKFNKIHGNFDIRYNLLENLRLCPVEVDGDFDCSGNYLKTLKGAPERVGKNFTVRTRGHLLTSVFCLKTLEGCSKSIGGSLDITGNGIYSLEYFPEHLGHRFNCENNPIHCIWILFEDKNKIEVFNAYDPIRPPIGIPYKDFSKESKPTLYLDILELFFENEIRHRDHKIENKRKAADNILSYYNVVNSDNSRVNLMDFLNKISI